MNPTRNKFWLSVTAATLATGLAFTMAACKANPAAAPIVNGAPDPSAVNGNMAPVDGQSGGQTTQVMGQSQSYAPQQSSESYTQAPAPVEQGYSDQSSAPDANYADQNVDGYATDAPPPLPEYDQPPAPDEDDLWTPGYWAWGDGGYYWVPGTWVTPPYYGALWTPPYWGFYGGRYGFHRGYWGLHIGYYGGIDYGFGYIGTGYWGGYWNDNHFYYNRSVNNVRFNTYVYNRDVVYNNRHYGMQPSNRVSYNGGRGGVNYAPRPAEIAAMHENHVGPSAAQEANHRAALSDRGNAFSANHGRPAQPALARPAGFNGRPAIGQMPAAVHQEQVRSQAIQQQRAGGAPGARPGEPNGGARPGEPNGGVRPATPTNTGRPGEPNNGGRPGEFNNGARPGEPANTMRPAVPQNNMRPAEPNNGARPATPQNNMHRDMPQTQARPETPQTARPQPQARPEAARPAPQQQRMEAPRPAPQQHVEAPRPAPQQHVEAPRPAPAARPAPAPRPAPAARPAGGEEHHK